MCRTPHSPLFNFQEIMLFYSKIIHNNNNKRSAAIAHTSRDNYLINLLAFNYVVNDSRREMHV